MHLEILNFKFCNFLRFSKWWRIWGYCISENKGTSLMVITYTINNAGIFGESVPFNSFSVWLLNLKDVFQQSENYCAFLICEADLQKVYIVYLILFDEKVRHEIFMALHIYIVGCPLFWQILNFKSLVPHKRFSLVCW